MSFALFKRGDTVRLQHGGPTMTVLSAPIEYDETNNYYDCGWFDGKRKFREKRFHQNALKPAPPCADSLRCQ